MSNEEIKHKIENALKAFNSGNLTTNASSLFNSLGYASEKRLSQTTFSPEEFLINFNRNASRPLNPTNALVSSWKQVNFLFQVTADEIKASSQLELDFGSKNKVDTTVIESYLFFALELTARDYTRTDLAIITREINKIFNMPVMILFRYGATVTLAIIDRRLNKIDESRDVLQKVTLIKDISIVSPHRAHIEILFDLSLNELQQQYEFTNFVELHRAWQEALDSSELNKKFFKELSNWYFWALQNVAFPKDAGADTEVRNATSVIRLITRLIFIWFIKEKNLVPDELFNQRKLQGILKYVDPKESTYYKAILQNLFFATLNQEMNTPEKPNIRQFRGKSKQPNGRDQHYGITNLYRYEDYFHNPDQAVQLFSTIPFLNGGLFECLDKPDKDETTKMLRVDGFSDHKDNEIRVPDFLFFSNERDVDLNEIYDTKNKSYKVRGLIDILNRYKFTINENTPIEEEVALDPELLGKVFENLLASYNPETQTTARKATGSHYTPRDIVNHMVDESLIAYLTNCLKEKLPALVKTDGLEDILREVFTYKEYKDNEHYFNAAETSALIDAIDKLKALDPACGSGAFPMGILHKLVFILGKLDPHNKLWKERQLAKAEEIEDPLAREKWITDIEDSFERNEMDYGRKLYLIQNCIYGVDIQPIAVQIAKLRFFISLVVNQKLDEKRVNRGILPLPNLETKFVAANTLIGLDKPKLGQILILRNPEIVQKERELAAVRQRYFTARSQKIKKNCRDEDSRLRAELSVLLVRDGFTGETALKVAAWDPYDQNTHAEWFDPEWMFGLSTGFDIIIANPPYINVQSLGQFAEIYRKHFSVAYGSYDIYVLFFEKSLELLKNKGVITFITSNKYFIADYGIKLRQHILQNAKILGLIDLADCAKVFESVFISPAITMLSKGKIDSYTLPVMLLKDDDLKDIENKEPHLCDIGMFLESTNNVFDIYIKDEHSQILSKMLVGSLKLNIVADVRTGIMGFEYWDFEPYIVDGFKKNHVRMITNSHLDRYHFLFGKKIDLYKKDYHDPYLDIRNAPINANTMQLFLKKKIIVRGVASKLSAQFDDQGYGALVAVHTVISKNETEYDNKYLLALINSRLFNWYHLIKFYTARIPQGSLRYPISFLSDLPIKIPKKSAQPLIVNDVDNILAITKDEDYISNPTKQAKVKDLEENIDQLVYQLYELTPEEIALVEAKSKI